MGDVPALLALLLYQAAKLSMVKAGCSHQVTDDPEAKQGHLLSLFVRHVDLLGVKWESIKRFPYHHQEMCGRGTLR
jgi:hypothetical protein